MLPERGPPPQLPEAPARPPAVPLTGGAFAALRYRNFRLFYGGQLLSLTGTWVQTTALGWLVLQLTNSELLLGLVTASTMFPVLLLALYAGVIADQADKRKILVIAQTIMLVSALVLAVLTHMGAVNVGWILALVLLHGTAKAFEVPTRQSFFVDLVGKDDLTNAIALNSAAFNASRIVGPALAGVLIGTVGIAAAFYLNAASYLAVLAGLLAIRLPRFRPPSGPRSLRKNLREGFDYIRENRLARTLVGLIATISILGLPYAMLMPVFARDILQVGAGGLGWLLAASGAGALAGGLALAAGASRVPRGPLLVGAGIAFSVFLGAFALSKSFLLSLVLLAGAGFSLILTSATTNAILQSQVPNELRGRVMSVYVFMYLGMMPVGSLLAGALARWIGAPAALALGAALLLVIMLALRFYAPRLREVR